MSTKQKLIDTLKENKQKYEKKSSYQSHMDYYNKLKDKGITKKQEYSIPAIDSVGRISSFESK